MFNATLFCQVPTTKHIAQIARDAEAVNDASILQALALADLDGLEYLLDKTLPTDALDVLMAHPDVFIIESEGFSARKQCYQYNVVLSDGIECAVDIKA